MTMVHLGVLAGLISEIATLERRNAGFKLTTALSAARPNLAAEGAWDLAQAGCTHLLSYGLAGGLAPSLAPGAVLLPEAILDESGKSYAVDTAWHERMMALLAPLDPVTAPLIGVERAIAGLDDKSALAAQSGAAAVDMESQHLAREALSRGRPFLVLRVVVDTAAHVLPPAAMAAVTKNGGTSLPAILLSILSRPGQLPDLIRLGQAAKRANASLLRCGHLCGDRGFAIA